MGGPPGTKELAEIARLTRARELAALAVLARLAHRVKEAETNVETLRAEDHTPNASLDAVVVEKWRVWKTQELGRRTAKLAAARAEYEREAKLCGVAIAEHAVVDKLMEQADKRERKACEIRRDATSPDERCP